jgi:S1-C subfamily serine protease
VEIEVQLADGRQARARVVGSDPETDIAVLKIELGNLPTIVLGDQGGLQVGDAVLAIGNPFNVGQTVTAGIVSALNRNRIDNSPFQSFIQTDAGINTAIFSRDGGSLGIGFAVPVDTARRVMEALVREGQVNRGWLGVEPQDLSAELAESLQLPVRSGVLITGVLQDGPAARGGLRPGDVVVRVGDETVADTGDLLTAVAALPPESQVRLQVQRGAQALELRVTLARRPPPERRMR